MSAAIANADKLDLVKLQRLAHLLKSLNKGELETLELLLDNDASEMINQSITEFRQGKGIPIDQW
ncbi:MAG: hypothetical protein M0Q91_17570 [Methanoregula sp.]|jgi:hypothetical protein|nr:hypothetical protein [Methanoregula sp.]